MTPAAAERRATDPGSRVLSPEEVAAWPPAGPPSADADLHRPLRDALQRHGLWGPHQVAGRHQPIGCVALEITQRCNLDCTLCYLSEHSEATHDLPLEEVFRRIELIARHYGGGAHVQISGGDPTLRRRDELAAIVHRVAQRGLRRRCSPTASGRPVICCASWPRPDCATWRFTST